jgi:hypothetical protein
MLGYGLDGRGSRFRFPVGAGNFSLHRVQNGCVETREALTRVADLQAEIRIRDLLNKKQEF